jgi:hypothetical protein
MNGSVEVGAHEFCSEVAGRKTRKESLFAVLPELQLKFQNSGVTVTNWDRVRWFESPTTYPNRAYALRQMGKNRIQKTGARRQNKTGLFAPALAF